MKHSAITPAKISSKTFIIPIYQRLFAWTTDEISILLNDLYEQYCKGKINERHEHYYIGLLTATHNKELVDGQQRFTVLMLIAIAIMNKYPNSQWSTFVKVEGRPRLTFAARPYDAKYLEALIDGVNISDDINKEMSSGINTISTFLDKVKVEDCEDFCDYLYNHIAFFLQELPEGYSGKMLNKYFESMNSTGRNLENHEILKVELLELAHIEENLREYDRLISLWNQSSRMSQTIFSTSEDEQSRSRYHKIIDQIKDGTFNCDVTDDTEHSRSIEEVIEGVYNYEPNTTKNKSSMRSFLNFTDFLLQVLYLRLERQKVKIENKSEFFKPEYLRLTFQKYLKAEPSEIISFIHELFESRIILDWAVIRVDDNYDYNLALTKSDSSKLQQYEAMLYVSSSRDTYYEWIPFILKYVKKHGDDEDSLLHALIENDNKNNPINKYTVDDFYYRNFKRYFYRRLDYFLWEQIVHKNTTEKIINTPISNNDWNELKAAVSSYKFHSYNSEEHLYPRHDEKQNVIDKWVTNDGKKDEGFINAFGNLALISQPFNSFQSDDALNRKFGSIRDQILQKKLESIKLALMYYSAQGKAENWTVKVSSEHGELMFKYLEQTYENTLQGREADIVT